MLYKFHKISTGTFKTKETFHYATMKKTPQTLKQFPSFTSEGQCELICCPNSLSSWVCLSLYLTQLAWRSKGLLATFVVSSQSMANGMLLWAWCRAGCVIGSIWYWKKNIIQFIARITKRKDWPLTLPQNIASSPSDITQRTKSLTQKLGGD